MIPHEMFTAVGLEPLMSSTPALPELYFKFSCSANVIMDLYGHWKTVMNDADNHLVLCAVRIDITDDGPIAIFYRREPCSHTAMRDALITACSLLLEQQ